MISMKQEPYIVSILVPVYGVEKYIERCARSIFEQTYHNLDIVFVDDCTPDKSIEILKRVLEDYPDRKAQTRIIRHEQNRGLSAARNTAVAAAAGTFLTHVDSDDWIERDAVEAMVKKQIETGVEIVAGKKVINNSEPYDRYSCPAYKNKFEYMEYMLLGLWPHECWGSIIKRSLYTNNNLRNLEGQNQCEDFRMMLMLLWYAKSECNLDKVVYHYFMSEDSYCRSKKTWEQMKSMQSQNMNNVVSTTTFLKDKDKKLYFLSCKNTINTAYVFMMDSLHHHDYRWFRVMCSTVLSYPLAVINKTLGWKATLLFCLPMKRFTFSVYQHLIDVYSR